MIVEICCTSKSSLHNSIEGGASRLEVCENLMEDGLTPSLGFLKEVLETTSLSVHVLIRPRAGNFVYTQEEIQTTTLQIEQVKSMGINGVVIGALNRDQNLPLAVLKKWVQVAQPLDLTFHRAFDKTEKPIESLKKIMDLGFDRILTSGQESTAKKGLPLLKEMQTVAKEQIVIMPGGGINIHNCELFFREGFKEIHLSAKGKKKTTTGEPISDLDTIKQVVSTASRYTQ